MLCFTDLEVRMGRTRGIDSIMIIRCDAMQCDPTAVALSFAYTLPNRLISVGIQDLCDSA